MAGGGWNVTALAEWRSPEMSGIGWIWGLILTLIEVFPGIQ